MVVDHFHLVRFATNNTVTAITNARTKGTNRLIKPLSGLKSPLVVSVPLRFDYASPVASA